LGALLAITALAGVPELRAQQQIWVRGDHEIQQEIQYIEDPAVVRLKQQELWQAQEQELATQREVNRVIRELERQARAQEDQQRWERSLEQQRIWANAQRAQPQQSNEQLAVVLEDVVRDMESQYRQIQSLRTQVSDLQQQVEVLQEAMNRMAMEVNPGTSPISGAR
jgi:chromosome segregation ATPase